MSYPTERLHDNPVWYEMIGLILGKTALNSIAYITERFDVTYDDDDDRDCIREQLAAEVLGHVEPV